MIFRCGLSCTHRSITRDDVHGWTSVAGGRTPGATEENRIQAIADNGHTMTYTYDASGQRITKRGPQGETGYVNQWMTLRNGEVGTKHVFAGTSRVVSKLVKQDKPNTKRNSSNNKKNGQGKARIVYEKDQYYYHPDHLGTTAYITHTNGQIYQHLEYFPFGETWVEEHSNKQRTPYLFTGKELDEETGLYYFGARYYDPRTSVWQSTDPSLEEFLSNKSGYVEFGRRASLYTYSRNNPILLSDPDGKDYELLIGGPYDNHSYGHVALRVFGEGYDKTYDFGRYGEVRGAFGSEGQGVLRVWGSPSSYISSENRTGRETTGYVFETTPTQDKATMEHFSKLMKNAKKQFKDPSGRDFTSYILEQDYHATDQNCTTMCLTGIGAGDEALEGLLSDPSESKGRGLNWIEKQAAGDAIGSGIFMPEDLKAAAEKSGLFSEKRIYKADNPLPKTGE